MMPFGAQCNVHLDGCIMYNIYEYDDNEYDI